MPKSYEVLERSFINGQLYEPGETLTLEIDSPGGNLRPVDDTESSAGKSGAKKSGIAGKELTAA